MARALIVACGCWGRELGRELADRGWQVRGTSRTGDGVGRIEEAGFEGAQADPERPGTILDLVGDVTAVIWLLGSAAGDDALVEAVHGPRLERLLEKLVDTPVRVFAYQREGTAPDRLLEGGRALLERASGTWRLPVAFLSDPAGTGPEWAASASDRLEAALAR